MAYIVVRTIKGRRYRYLQWSYREGNKVRTASQYLGPADSGSGGADLPETKPPRQRPVRDPPFDVEAELRNMKEKEAAAKARAAQVYAMLGVTMPAGDPVPIEKPTPSVGALMASKDTSTNSAKEDGPSGTDTAVEGMDPGASSAP